MNEQLQQYARQTLKEGPAQQYPEVFGILKRELETRQHNLVATGNQELEKEIAEIEAFIAEIFVDNPPDTP